MEAGVGIEPAYTDLQSAAWPLCHPAARSLHGGPFARVVGRPIVPKENGEAFSGFPACTLERETSLELATSTLARLRSTN